MPAPQPPQSAHLTLLHPAAAARSASLCHVRRESRERREFEPRGEEVEIGVTGGRRTRSGALCADVSHDQRAVSTTAKSDREQASSITEPFANELLEPKSQLSLIRTRREVGYTAPLLTQRRQRASQIVESSGVWVQQKLAPDYPQWRGRVAVIVSNIRGSLRRLIQSLCDVAPTEPGAGLRDTRRPSHGGQRTEAHGVSEHGLSFRARVHPQSTMQDARSLRANAERGAFDRSSGGLRTRAQRIAAKKRGELVRGSKRVDRVASRWVADGSHSGLCCSQRGQALNRRHNVNGPVSIDEVRAARWRSGEDRV